MLAKICSGVGDHFPLAQGAGRNIIFKEIIYIDPDEDYDGFCDMNEKNEKRRAMSQFFVNLMKNEVIDNKEIIKIILALHEQIFEFLKEHPFL